jgi:hypothetical protein
MEKRALATRPRYFVSDASGINKVHFFGHGPSHCRVDGDLGRRLSRKFRSRPVRSVL